MVQFRYYSVKEGWFHTVDSVAAHVARRNLNVFYEIGVAHGRGISVLLICPKLELLPIDLRSAPVITYVPGQIDRRRISFALKEQVAHVIARQSSPLEGQHRYLAIQATAGAPYLDRSRPAMPDVPELAGSEFEREIGSLLSSQGWEFQAAGENKDKDAVDFIVWNTDSDPTLALLGNPIAIEVKGPGINRQAVTRTAQQIKRQGLPAIIFVTSVALGRRLRNSLTTAANAAGVLAVVLDEADLQEIRKDHDFAAQVKKRLTEFRYYV